MGTGINCWIEYDEHSDPPFSGDTEVLPLTEWRELDGAKDYAVYGAISGIRNETGIPSLIDRRGIPPNASWQVKKELSGESTPVSWLFPSEVPACLNHHNVQADLISLEMTCVLKLLEFMAREIGDDRVRFVFEIE